MRAGVKITHGCTHGCKHITINNLPFCVSITRSRHRFILGKPHHQVDIYNFGFIGHSVRGRVPS